MTDGLLLTARLVLAAVLAVAAAGKLADREGSRRAVTAFGVPDGVAAPLAALLPLAELTAAGLLLGSPTARAGAALALVLLLAFSAGIARALLRGERPDCHCFGALHSAPAGPGALVRNAALAGLAACTLLAGPGAGALGWIGGLSASEALGLAALTVALCSGAACGALALALLRRHGALLLRVDELEQRLLEEGIDVRPAAPEAGLAVGEPAPVDALPGLAARLDGERDLLLIFTDPDCGPCRTLAPAIAGWREDDARVAVATAGRDGDLADPGERGYAAFALAGTPGAVLIGRDGAIASAVATGPDAVTALHAQALLAAKRPRAGDPVPDLGLRGLDGEPVSLGTDEATVLLWNPTCGFCAELKPAVLAAQARGARIVVVSSGDAQATLAEGFRGPVALDPAFALGEALGTHGTPSGVRIRDGRLASEPVVGIGDVRALLGVLDVVRHG